MEWNNGGAYIVRTWLGKVLLQVGVEPPLCGASVAMDGSCGGDENDHMLARPRAEPAGSALGVQCQLLWVSPLHVRSARLI